MTEPILPESEVVRRVRERIKRGQLSVVRPETIHGGFGTGRSLCAACEEIIAAGKVEYDIEDPQSKERLYFHFACFVIWQRECTERLN